MNEWPDELWQNEQSPMRDTFDLSANDVDAVIEFLQCITESNDHRAVRGLLLTWCCFAATVSLAATAGLSSILILLRRRGIGFRRGLRHTV